MLVRVVCPILPLARSVAAALEAAGHQVEVSPQPAFSCELRHTGAVLPSYTALAAAVLPFEVTLSRVGRLDGADVELHLGDRKGLAAWDVRVRTDSAGLGERLMPRFQELGFASDGVDNDETDRNRMVYGGASAFARAAVRWVLRSEQLTVAEDKSWGDEDNDIWLYLRDPLFDGRDLRPHIGVHLGGDDLELLEGLAERLGAAGFTKVSFGVDKAGPGKLRIEAGPLRKNPENLHQLRSMVAQFLSEHPIDDERYPLEVVDGEGSTAVVSLPLRAVLDGRLPPYAGSFPDRWDVVIRTDDRSKVEAARQELESLGYRVRYEPLSGAALAFSARWGAAAAHFPVVELFTGMLERLRDQLGAHPVFRVLTTRSLDEDDVKIELTVPTAGLTEAGFAHQLRLASAQYSFTLRAPVPESYRRYADTISPYGFGSFQLTADADYASPALRFGGAPVQLIEHLADLYERFYGRRPAVEKVWNDSDNDIWLCVPEPAVTHGAGPAGPSQSALSEWFVDAEAQPAVPLIELSERELRVGHVRLPRGQGGHELVPRAEQFDHYCLDQLTAETLLHVAESVSLREPCLLEGETSVSKTSVVQLLGYLAQRPVVRLNLNGQTDTGELVGRYVPQSSSSLPVAPEELLAASELLEPESRFILERARDAGRNLSEVEVQQVMANERMSARPWRWQDGLVVAALRHGWWLVLDELNLAEPQILERLNSLLERHPTLVLTEHDNSVFGPGGTPVHPDFRVFATMNPAEYAGRSVLSPAYRDRWRGYRYVEAPGEAEYRAMLSFAVFGVEPDVRLLGQAYTGRELAAPYPALAEVPDIERFLAALARFHASLEQAVGRRGGLGSRRRERYVFTRRGLLSVLDYLVSAVAEHDPVRTMRVALYRYYLGRMTHPEDRGVVVELLDAAGIGPNVWDLNLAQQEPEDPDGDELSEGQQRLLRALLSATPGGVAALSEEAIADLAAQLGASESSVWAFLAGEE